MTWIFGTIDIRTILTVPVYKHEIFPYFLRSLTSLNNFGAITDFISPSILFSHYFFILRTFFIIPSQHIKFTIFICEETCLVPYKISQGTWVFFFYYICRTWYKAFLLLDTWTYNYWILFLDINIMSWIMCEWMSGKNRKKRGKSKNLSSMYLRGMMSHFISLSNSRMITRSTCW